MGENIALGKPVSAPGARDLVSLGNLTDGNAGTGGGATHASQIVVDLQGSFIIEKIRLREGGVGWMDIWSDVHYIEVLEAGTWRGVGSWSGYVDGRWIEKTFAAKTITKFRVRIPSDVWDQAFYELEAYTLQAVTVKAKATLTGGSPSSLLIKVFRNGVKIEECPFDDVHKGETRECVVTTTPDTFAAYARAENPWGVAEAWYPPTYPITFTSYRTEDGVEETGLPVILDGVEIGTTRVTVELGGDHDVLIGHPVGRVKDRWEEI